VLGPQEIAVPLVHLFDYQHQNELSMTATLDARSVALYLKDNPRFFDDHPELLTGLRLTTQLGGRTVSLQERQTEILREKLKALELKLSHLNRIAKENDAIMAKFHMWVDTLLLSQADDKSPDTLIDAMRDGFGIQSVSLRLWDVADEHANAWFAQKVSEETREFANQLHHPYCGPSSGQPGVVWLDDAANMQSAALLSLQNLDTKKSFGLLVLGSTDPQRFSADLATDFLTRIAHTASAAFQNMVK
jgi:uncharacterized protein YigA (DUF484 family)